MTKPDDPRLPQARATLVCDARAELGEGPVWDPRRRCLFWVDILGRALHRYHPDTSEDTVFPMPEQLGCVGLAPDGRLLAAFPHRLAWVNADDGSIGETLCEIEPGLPANRCNDGRFDRAGRFWVGTMACSGKREGAGSLYRINSKHAERVLEGLTVSNGIGWSGDDRTMFFADSPEREIWAFDFDPAAGTVSNRRTVIRVPEELGVPDGFCVDAHDTLWVGHWGAGAVCRWNPRDGSLMGIVRTGCPHTTSCCIGGAGELYITTARAGLDADALRASPASGGLFRFDPRAFLSRPPAPAGA